MDLAQLLRDSRDKNSQLSEEVKELKQRLLEVQGDNKVPVHNAETSAMTACPPDPPPLFSAASSDDHHQAEGRGRRGRRSTLSCPRARRPGQAVGESSGAGQKPSAGHLGTSRSRSRVRSTDLCLRLESRVRFASLQNELLEHSVKSLSDELQDVCAERDVFQQKAHRLNVEMNHIVGGEDARILDVDALCMENRSAMGPVTVSVTSISIRSNVFIRDLLKGSKYLSALIPT